VNKIKGVRESWVAGIIITIIIMGILLVLAYTYLGSFGGL